MSEVAGALVSIGRGRISSDPDGLSLPGMQAVAWVKVMQQRTWGRWLSVPSSLGKQRGIAVLSEDDCVVERCRCRMSTSREGTELERSSMKGRKGMDVSIDLLSVHMHICAVLASNSKAI